jgi:hypothetical protein
MNNSKGEFNEGGIQITSRPKRGRKRLFLMNEIDYQVIFRIYKFKTINLG